MPRNVTIGFYGPIRPAKASSAPFHWARGMSSMMRSTTTTRTCEQRLFVPKQKAFAIAHRLQGTRIEDLRLKGPSVRVPYQ